MSTKPAARLRVRQLPQLGAGARVVVVDCPHSRTRLGIVAPTDRYMAQAEPYLKLSALYRHESECGDCDTEPVWSAHGLLELRAGVDRQWDALVADALRELRN